MPVNTYEANAKFRFTIIKHHNLNPSDAWSNSYEFKATATGSATILTGLAAVLAAFEQDFHHNTTIFDRVVVASWEEDSAPYNPANFLVYSLGFGGGVMPATDAVGLTTVLHVTRSPGFGRAGHLFYRNCLVEGDVIAPSGINTLGDLAAKNATFQTAISDSNLSDYMGFSPTEDLSMVMIDAAGVVIRPVLSMLVAGVTQVKTDHKWYNRTGSP